MKFSRLRDYSFKSLDIFFRLIYHKNSFEGLKLSRRLGIANCHDDVKNVISYKSNNFNVAASGIHLPLHKGIKCGSLIVADNFYRKSGLHFPAINGSLWKGLQ